jgi:hypothetical protein
MPRSGCEQFADVEPRFEWRAAVAAIASSLRPLRLCAKYFFAPPREPASYRTDAQTARKALAKWSISASTRAGRSVPGGVSR